MKRSSPLYDPVSFPAAYSSSLSNIQKGNQARTSRKNQDLAQCTRIIRRFDINEPSSSKYALKQLTIISIKNSISIIKSMINQSSHGLASINAIRYGIIVAVYISRKANTMFHSFLSFESGYKIQCDLLILTFACCCSNSSSNFRRRCTFVDIIFYSSSPYYETPAPNRLIAIPN